MGTSRCYFEAGFIEEATVLPGSRAGMSLTKRKLNMIICLPQHTAEPVPSFYVNDQYGFEQQIPDIRT